MSVEPMIVVLVDLLKLVPEVVEVYNVPGRCTQRVIWIAQQGNQLQQIYTVCCIARTSAM
jgi:hypothetical protein